VQSITASTREASNDMRDVSSISETAEQASRSVARSADEVGGTADILRSELALFLNAIAMTDEASRSQYERLDGAHSQALLHPPGDAGIQAEIVDISRGGVLLLTPWSTSAGTEVQVVLPGGNDPVSARMVRADGGHLALAFRQDAATLLRLDAALLQIAGMAERARAA
jgi:methyl-accepting chemotaxis protein